MLLLAIIILVAACHLFFQVSRLAVPRALVVVILLRSV